MELMEVMSELVEGSRGWACTRWKSEREIQEWGWQLEARESAGG